MPFLGPIQAEKKTFTWNYRPRCEGTPEWLPGRSPGLCDCQTGEPPLLIQGAVRSAGVYNIEGRPTLAGS